jgi:hypothetical protein
MTLPIPYEIPEYPGLMAVEIGDKVYVGGCMAFFLLGMKMLEKIQNKDKDTGS